MKKLSYNIKNEMIAKFLLSKFGMIITNWVFQGMRYMDSFERRYRLFTELVLFILLLMILAKIISLSYAALISFIFSHSLMWLLNGHFFSLLRTKENSIQDLICYIGDFNKRLQKCSCLDGALIFGGLSEGRFHKYSDVDVRLIKSKGFINGIKACNYAFSERFKALKMAFPLDVFVFDDFEELNKESKEQISPIILFDPKGELKIKYPNGKDYNAFRNELIGAR